jgi:predicted phage terminase large subunit-like protein
VPGALWKMAMIDAARIKRDDVNLEGFLRIVVAIDPAVTAHEDSDETGIIVAGLTRTNHVVVLDDVSCKESPLGWAKVVARVFAAHRCDRVIGEVNNGGDLVEGNLRAVWPDVPFRAVRASRGKAVRAEPVAALYEQGRVHHVGHFPLLEEQMCSWSPLNNTKSPDRLDALVWAITDLVVDEEETSGAFQIMPPVRISRY